jgi:hypothetical protein
MAIPKEQKEKGLDRRERHIVRRERGSRERENWAVLSSVAVNLGPPPLTPDY